MTTAWREVLDVLAELGRAARQSNHKKTQPVANVVEASATGRANSAPAVKPKRGKYAANAG